MIKIGRNGLNRIDGRKLGAFLVIAPPFAGLTSGMINAVLMIVGLFLVIPDGRLIFPKKFVLWATLFTGYCMLSYIWAQNTKTVFSTTASFLQVVILVLVMVIGIRSEEDIFLYINCMVFGAMIYSARLFFSHSLSYLLNVGRFGGGNALSIRFSMLSVLLFSYRKHYKLRFVPFILIIILTLVAFLQGSRKGFFILASGITLQILLEGFYSNRVGKVVKSIALIAISVIVLYFICIYTPLYNSIGNRIEQTINSFFQDADYKDSSTRTRAALIEDGIRIWLENPILGCGQDAFRYVNSVRYGYYSHNNFVEILANLGIIGFMIYYSFYFSTLWSLLKQVLKRNEKFTAAFIILTLIIFTDYMHVSYSSECNYVFIGFALSLVKIYKNL